MNDSKKKFLTRHDIEKNLKEIYKTAAVFNSVFIAFWFCVLIFIFICQNKLTKDGSTLLLWQEILPLLPVPFICVRITCLISALKKFLLKVFFQIMEYFFNHPNVALERSEILNHVWGNMYYGDDKVVDVNIRRLRMKLEDDPSSPHHLTTIWGIGYKWLV